MQLYKYWPIILSAVFMIAIPHAHAVCPLTDYQADFAKADSVFVGKIQNYDAKTGLAVLRVSYLWKGSQWSNQTAQIASVSSRFQPDDNGLYYLQKGKDGLLTTDVCNRSTSLDQAAEFTFYLFISIAAWLTFMFLLRFIFIFTFRSLSASIVGLLYCLTIALGLTLIIPNLILHLFALPFIAQFIVTPALFFVCAFIGLLVGMARKEALVANRFPPFAIALGVFSIAELLTIIFFQPMTALMASASMLLIADSWRSGIRFESTDIAIKHRLQATILISVSSLILLIAVGIFFQRWASL